MVKIILTWNYHPNESAATLPMTRMIKPLLEQRGHEIQIVKIPMTFEGIKTKKIGGNERNNVCKQFLRALRKQFPNSIIIDMHSSPDLMMKRNNVVAVERMRKIRKLKARVSRVTTTPRPISENEPEPHSPELELSNLSAYLFEIPNLYTLGLLL